MRAALESLEPHIGELYEAVARYVEHGDGGMVVIGGVEIQEWPSDNKGVFRVAVKCLGKKPAFI